MSIEVLLRRSIEGVGAVGQVVRVRDGYARNYLLPYSLAALVTPDAMRHIEKDKAAEAVREAAEAKERAALTEKLAAVELRIECRAGEDGHLYGSVGPRQIVDALKRHGFRFEERQIRFEIVRQLGEYQVPIHLTGEHGVNVRMLVVLDAEDAKAHAEAAAQRAAEEAFSARITAERGEAPAAPAPEPVVLAEPDAGEGQPKGGKRGKKGKGGDEAAKAEAAGGSKDAGSKDAGSKDAGSKDAGSKDAGSKDSGSKGAKGGGKGSKGEKSAKGKK